MLTNCLNKYLKNSFLRKFIYFISHQQYQNAILHKFVHKENQIFTDKILTLSLTEQNYKRKAKFSTLKHLQQQQANIKMQKQVQQSNSMDQQQKNPVEQYDPQLCAQMLSRQKKPHSDQQARGIKRRQKLQQYNNDFKNPELRKQRNRQRHQKQKQKLHKQFIGKTEEQIRQFLINRKRQKQELKQRVHQSVQQSANLPFLIDIAYEHRMNQKQNKSLASQIHLIMKVIKRFERPPNIHLCGVKGRAKEQLQIMGYQHWPLKSYTQQLKQCLAMKKFEGKNVYYLSPDAKQSIHNVEQNDIFIIGGLVDRTVLKNASLNRAEELGIEARSLPIRSFMKQRTCLNLDHIVAIISKFTEVQDWKAAFDFGAPKRWKKDEKGKQQDQQKSEQQKQ